MKTEAIRTCIQFRQEYETDSGIHLTQRASAELAIIDGKERVLDAKLNKILAEVVALEEENERLRERAKALMNLTPGGSEYMDDPARCVAFIRRKEEGLNKAMKRFKDRADKARREEREAIITLICEQRDSYLRTDANGQRWNTTLSDAFGWFLSKVRNRGKGET